MSEHPTDSPAIERMLPLYEGKMGYSYNYRAATFIGTGDTDIEPNSNYTYNAQIQPRNWVRESVVADRLARNNWGTKSALLGFRRVASSTNERTIISSFIPYGAASYGWILSAGPDAEELCLLLAQYGSFIMDFTLRQFLSQPSIPQGTFAQLPILPRSRFRFADSILNDTIKWIVQRVINLSVTGYELGPLAEELQLQPVALNDAQRAETRAELDALMFYLYGMGEEDIAYIMNTFPIVKGKDEEKYGEYRTERLILEKYRALFLG